MIFTDAKINDLPDIFEQMKANFIVDELRSYDDIVRLFGHNYNIVHIVHEEKNVGFMGLWQVGEYTFLEHFVIYEQFRNSGLGGQALRLLQKNVGRLLLECEPPVEPMAARRLDFYLRNGMRLNEQDYYQPPYRPNGNACYLKLMSYPEALADFDDVAAMVYKTVYGIDYEQRKYFRNNAG